MFVLCSTKKEPKANTKASPFVAKALSRLGVLSSRQGLTATVTSLNGLSLSLCARVYRLSDNTSAMWNA